MARLIDSDKRIAEIKNQYCTGCDNYGGVRCRACWVDDAICLIDDAPTVDAVEVVRCLDCEIHGHCATEDVFYFAGISNPFCCAGKRKDGDGYGNCLVHHGADLRGDPDGGGIEHHCQREDQP